MPARNAAGKATRAAAIASSTSSASTTASSSAAAAATAGVSKGDSNYDVRFLRTFLRAALHGHSPHWQRDGWKSSQVKHGRNSDPYRYLSRDLIELDLTHSQRPGGKVVIGLDHEQNGGEPMRQFHVDPERAERKRAHRLAKASQGRAAAAAAAAKSIGSSGQQSRRSYATRAVRSLSTASRREQEAASATTALQRPDVAELVEDLSNHEDEEGAPGEDAENVEDLLQNGSAEPGDARGDLPTVLSRQSQQLQAGDWVQARIYGQSAGYIYLGTDTSRTGKASRAIVHGQGNTLHSLRKEDLLFRIPGLVSASTAEQSTKMLRLSPPEYLEDLEEIDARNLAAAAGRADRKRPVAPSESSPDAASEVTVDAEELWEEYGLDFGSKGWQDAFEAKLAVGRTLRNIVQQQEKIQTEILMKGIRDIYDRLVRAVRNAPKKGKSNSKGKSKATDSTFSSEGSTASSDIYVSTSQIYRELYCGEADFFTKEQEQFRMLAVHDYFLRDSEHYVADAIDILSSSRYRVRPPAEVDNLRTVREWVRKGSPEVVTFSAKVRDIRRRVKNATNSSVFPGAGHGELALLALPNIPTWTDADLAIIQFLQNSLEMKRKLQVNPYEAYAAILVKSLSPVKDGIAASSETEGIPAFMYMRVAVVRLLKDIGVYAEWENLVTRDREAGYEVWSKELEHARTHSPFAQRYIEPRDELDGIRHDFGDLPVYTIDDPGASELDDGISIEPCPPSLNDGLGRQTFWIHAHIADPTSSLRPTDDLAQQARRRVTSSYLPEALWPMINFEIIEKQGWSLGRQAASPQTDLLAASIRPHQQEGQKVLTFSARLDEDGNVLEQTIRPGVVNIVIMTTYSAIDDLFRKETAPTAALSNSGAANDMPGDAIERLLWPTSHSHHDAADASKVPSRTLSPLPPSAVEDMARLDRLSTKVRMARVRSTALSWYGNSASVRLTTRPLQSSFEVLPTPTFYANQPSLEFSLPFPFSPSAAVSLSGRQQKEERSHAALLVSECMILAGRIAARHLGERGVPAPFRAQDAPAGASAAGIPDLLALRDPQTGEVDVSEVLRRRIELRPAYFSLTPAGHWPMGIGAEGYVRATSPLRRYTDLLAHWQIKGTLKHGRTGPPFSTADLQSLIGQTERVTRQRMRSENRAKTFWKTYLIRNKLEEVRKNPEADPVAAQLLLQGLTGIVGDSKLDYGALRRVTVIQIAELGVAATLITEAKSETFASGSRLRIEIAGIILDEYSKIYVKLRAQ